MIAYLHDLFHFDPSEKKFGDLQRTLKEYHFLLKVALIGIQHLLNTNLEKFDSLVGENACQIRAIYILLIATGDLSHFMQLRNNLEQALIAIESLVEPAAMRKLMQEGLSLIEVIKKHQLEISLAKDELFVVQSYLLTEMKESKQEGEILTSILMQEKCSPSNLQKQHPEISYSFIDKLAKKLRKDLSIASIDFVKKIASDLEDFSSIKMVSDDFVVEHNTLLCIPTFWSFKTLFTLAQKKNIPLIFHVQFLDYEGSGYRIVDEEYIYYKICEEQKIHVESHPTEYERSSPACIIQGVICPKNGSKMSKQEWRQTIKNFSVFDMLLAMGADHRQYPHTDHSLLIEDPEYFHYKAYAENNGFSLTNPTTFFVRHIYSSLANKILPTPPKPIESRTRKSNSLEWKFGKERHSTQGLSKISKWPEKKFASQFLTIKDGMN